MAFNVISYFNFRNLENTTVTFSGSEIFLIGENGQGKSNVLESIYMLCYGSSFRAKKESHIITHGNDTMSLRGRYQNDDTYPHEIGLKIIKSKKNIVYDGKNVTDRKDIIFNNPCIIFTHEDISIVNGSPENKRRFFDQTISLYDPTYIDILRNYKKILKYRNILLKEKNNMLLDVYDSQLIEIGLRLQEKRRESLIHFDTYFSSLFNKITDLTSDLDIVYKPSWPHSGDSSQISEIMKKSRENDIKQGFTTKGPHRDNFSFMLGSLDFSLSASTGQLRLISLILKVTQANFFFKNSGKKPILLLDDVLLELDWKKRKKFLENLPEYEQAFFTFLPGDNDKIPFFTRGKKCIVKGGVITAET